MAKLVVETVRVSSHKRGVHKKLENVKNKKNIVTRTKKAKKAAGKQKRDARGRFVKRR